MFACLYLPPPVNATSVRGEGKGERGTPPASALRATAGKHVSHATLVQVARDFSPRVETHGERTVTLDISGLGSLIGAPRAIGEELRRSAADAGLRVHIAIAATSTAAILLAHGRAGLTVVPRGGEAQALAPLSLRALAEVLAGSRLQASGSRPEARSPEPEIDQLGRWGLRTLGDLAALPSAQLSARLGQNGLRWQTWARGEEVRPLVPSGLAESFEESLDLEWPVEGLEPLSFVLARLLEPLCDRLERQDRGAVTLQVRLTLVTSASARSAMAGPRRSLGEGGRVMHERVVELPAPIRDSRVLRTLALLDLESNPAPAAIDRVTVGVQVTEGRVLQFGLFARALPSDTLTTLMARLGALMGSDRVGAPSLVDTYRPGAFAMAKFEPASAPANRLIPNPQSLLPNPPSLLPNPPSLLPNAAPASVLRRFRSPIPARVTVERGRPTRVTSDRRGFGGGRVERCEGPWRSSGDWWSASAASPLRRDKSAAALRASAFAPGGATADKSAGRHAWDCDEWDVGLDDGAVYRVSQAREDGAWFIDGMLD